MSAAETRAPTAPAVGRPVGPSVLVDAFALGGSGPAGKAIPSATVSRLPVYLRALHDLAEARIDTVSSGELAEAAGVTPSQLRKDLSLLGSYGTRGVGYDVALLQRRIGREVGSSHDWPVVILGIGNLGRALANYAGFSTRGFRIVALVDTSAALVGRPVNGVTVSDLADLESVLARTHAAIAVIATPAAVAQSVADRLVAHGVTSILNFATTVLVVPDGVTVRKVDLGQELQILAYHEQRKTEPEPAGSRLAPEHDDQVGVPALATTAEGDR